MVQERKALASNDTQLRSRLLGEFHTLLAGGNCRQSGAARHSQKADRRHLTGRDAFVVKP
jgi:hypothetical protein